MLAVIEITLIGTKSMQETNQKALS